MEYPYLFEPITIKGLELKNRVVFPAMGTGFLDNGYVTDEFIDYHVARALGGCALSITEAASVHGPSAPRNLLMHIWDDKFLPGLRRFTTAMHEAGGKVCVQLWQGGPSAGLADPEAVMVVPSDLEVRGTTYPGASVELIHEVVAAHGRAARRAVEAGFDCVEFHAGHGYSPHCFLSGAMNRRTDEYGGSLENRARYLLECIAAIRANIPDDMPLLLRTVAQDDYVDGGLTIEEVIAFCTLAKEAGADVLDVSRGNKFPIGPGNFGMKLEVPPIDIPRGFNIENAARIKRETGMPTIGVGRINDPGFAEEILSGGKTDMVAVGRGQIADPEFCAKALSGASDAIIRCIACNQGCYDKLTAPQDKRISCMRNPAVGREREFEIVRTTSPKRVAVAGGGMAGMEAAIVLQERGHRPVLFEESDALGGQLLLAGVAPRKEEMREAAISRGEQTRKAGVDIRLGTPVTAQVLDDVEPEAIIISTGAGPVRPAIPGIDLPHVVNAFDVLAGRALPTGRVVVIGGGLIGLEIAEYVAEHDPDCEITVVEMLDGVGKDLGMLRKMAVMESLHAEGITTLVGARCSEITGGTVVVEQDGGQKILDCDHVVIAVGTAPRDHAEIERYGKENDIPCYVIGDALRSRRAVDAIAEAAELARVI